MIYLNPLLSLDVTPPICGSLASFPVEFFVLFYSGMPNGARETRHEHTEHWEPTSMEAAERILGHSQLECGFTTQQTDSGQQCCLHYILMVIVSGR